MKLSYDRAWADAVSMAQRHSEILAVMAGMFLLIPNFVRDLFLPMPEIVSLDSALETVETYYANNLGALFVLNAMILLGASAILGLLLDARKPTVAQALTTAFVMLPSIFVLNLLTNAMVFGGLMLLFVPGIYLVGRLAVATAWQMAHRSMNPLTAIGQSFAMTRGNGWRSAGLIFLIGLVAAIASSAVTAVVGVVLKLAVSTAIGVQIEAFVSSIVAAITLFVGLMIAAAIYRQLAELPRNGT